MIRFLKKRKTFLLFIFFTLGTMLILTITFLDVGFSGRKVPGNERKRNIEHYRKTVEDCVKEKPRFNCWDEIFTKTLQEDGVMEAVWLLDKLREVDPIIASNCHDHAHLVGEVSYWNFYTKGSLNLNEESTLCEYGFYHGFMQEFGHHGDNFLEKAPEVCSVLVDNFSKEKAREKALEQCYHGIGHGLVYHYIDELGSNDMKLVTKALPECFRMFSGNEKDCTDGVYGGINLLYFGYHGYKISVKEDDPFWICHNKQEPYRGGCYVNLSASIFDFYSRDLSRALESVRPIENRESASVAVESLASASSHYFYWEDGFYSEAIKICQKLDRGLDEACLKGLAQGIINRARPGEAYKLAFDLCQNERLNAGGRESCLDGIFSRAFHNELESLDYLCSLVEGKYKDYCRI